MASGLPGDLSASWLCRLHNRSAAARPGGPGHGGHHHYTRQHPPVSARIWTLPMAPDSALALAAQLQARPNRSHPGRIAPHPVTVNLIQRWNWTDVFSLLLTLGLVAVAAAELRSAHKARQRRERAADRMVKPQAHTL